MTVRQVWPEQAAEAAWTQTDELTLTLANLLLLWRYEWTLAHVSEADAAGIDPPVLLRRPWEDQAEAPGPAATPAPDHFATREEIRAFFGPDIVYSPD